MADSIPLHEALLVLVSVPGMLMLMVWPSWLCLCPGGNIPSQDSVACFSEEETVSLRALFLCPAPAQGLENQELCAVFGWVLSDNSLLDEFQLEQLAVETFPVETSSFLLASSSAAATSILGPLLCTRELSHLTQLRLKLAQTSFCSLSSNCQYIINRRLAVLFY